jgi:hypothetical protein
MKYIIFIITLLVGCKSSEHEFTPLIEPISGTTIAQGNSFLVRMVVNSDNDTSYMAFYNRNIKTGIIELFNSSLKIDGTQGSILYFKKFDVSMMSEFEKIK